MSKENVRCFYSNNFYDFYKVCKEKHGIECIRGELSKNHGSDPSTTKKLEMMKF